MPLQLEHLKRIRHSRRGTQAAGIDDDDDDDRLEIVVCPGRFLQQLPGEAARRLGPTREALVPRFAPSSREEFTAWGAYWPLNYRPRGQEGPPERVSEQDAALFASKRAALRREDAAMRALSGAPGMGALMVNPANDAVGMQRIDLPASACVLYLLTHCYAMHCHRWWPRARRA